MRNLANIVAAFALAVAATATARSTEDAAAFLKTVEGFRATAYRDAGGTRTIGYGFTSKAMLRKGRLTEAEASAELVRRCKDIARRLRREGVRHLTPREEAAIVSFVYNVGWGGFRGSTMFRLLKEGKRGAAVAAEFSKWVYVTRGGRKIVSEGLRARREKERQKFMG